MSIMARVVRNEFEYKLTLSIAMKTDEELEYQAREDLVVRARPEEVFQVATMQPRRGGIAAHIGHAETFARATLTVAETAEWKAATTFFSTAATG
jgi:hypothetical protein